MNTTFPIHVKSKLFLAPMAGYTDLPFRLIAHTSGAGMVFSELLSADGIVRSNKKTLAMLSFSDEEKPLGIQIFGNDPAVMAEAAVRLLSHSPDCIDINAGCCAPKVCNNGKGAGLLNNVELLHRIACAVVKSVDIPVSAKIRLGFTQGTKNYREVVAALEQAGVSFITVHGRTRDQFYSGKADWDAIGTIADFSKVPIVGNGDIASYEDAMEKLSTSGCAAVMIGRAAIGNPWIFCGQQPSYQEKIAMIKKHYECMVQHYGNYGIILMRKHIVHYLKGFSGAVKLRQKLLTLTSMDEILEVLHY
ncbi:MAG TPA: tRNA dihydrouridine synthase DusB [Spirochaetota bacterium]|nr:tRNA dihydrouridine synthase DusB [Spirochaetota bacterium]